MFRGKASVTVDGTILLGKHVICDGFLHQRQVSIFTHIHDDHIRQFESALGFYNVYVTQQTRDMLVEIKDEMSLSFRNNFFPCNYNDPILYANEKIILRPAKHILGSCQVEVQSENMVIAYSSDFDMPGTEPIECDVLVMDATHGSQEYALSYDKSKITDDFIEIVRKELRSNRPVIISAHRGQLQEVMSLASENIDMSIPFVATAKDEALARIYQQNNFRINNLLIDTSQEAQEIFEGNGPYLKFAPMNESVDINRKDSCFIRIASDIAFRGRPWYQIGNQNKYSFNLSNHADINGILDYPSLCIFMCKPCLSSR